MGHANAQMLFRVYAKWIDGADKSREREKLNVGFRHKKRAFFGKPSGIKILTWRRERDSNSRRQGRPGSCQSEKTAWSRLKPQNSATDSATSCL
jgi:hypothetical protein